MKALLLVVALAVSVQAAQAAAPVTDAQAEYRQALAYRNGTGVAPDAALAARAMERAARAGLPQAMFMLANMLAAGEGVVRNEATAAAARRWLEQAAELGHPAALQELALREPDPRKAELLMRQAAHALQHTQGGVPGS